MTLVLKILTFVWPIFCGDMIIHFISLLVRLPGFSRHNLFQNNPVPASHELMHLSGNVYMHKQTGLTLVQSMACNLFDLVPNKWKVYAWTNDDKDLWCHIANIYFNTLVGNLLQLKTNGRNIHKRTRLGTKTSFPLTKINTLLLLLVMSLFTFLPVVDVIQI